LIACHPSSPSGGRRLLALVLTAPNEVVRRYGELTSGHAHWKNLEQHLTEAKHELKVVRAQVESLVDGSWAKHLAFVPDILAAKLADRRERGAIRMREDPCGSSRRPRGGSRRPPGASTGAAGRRSSFGSIRPGS
jgi:hypothetical protein